MAQRCPPSQIDIDSTSRFRTRFIVRVPATHSVSDVLAPEYFGQLAPANDIREGDLIEVEWEDFSKYGVLQVRAVERQLGLIMTKQRVQISEEAEIEDLPPGWGMVFRGGGSHWAITYEDQHVEAGFVTQERALTRILFLATQGAQRNAVRAARTGKVKVDA